MKYTKIKSMEQYNQYCDQHEKLTFKDYEILQYLIEENGLSKSQLAKQLDVSRQLITDILNYRRNISKAMVNKLADRFSLNSSAFSRPYQLKSVTKKKYKQTA